MFYNYVFVHSINYDHENHIYDYFSKGIDRINPTSFTESSKLLGLCTMYSTLMEHHSIYRVAMYAYKSIVLEIFYE